MAIPHGALVLVADGKKLLWLRNQGDSGMIDLRTESHDERADPMDRDIKSDAPGTQGQRWGDGRPAMDETDFHQQGEDRWIREAAEEVNRRALENDFDALAVVIPPKALGEFRKKLHKEAERRIVLTVNKTMTDRPIPDIEELLVGEGAPPA
ncbi:MAG TPA: host attachment family protein [Sphingomicrobium sp.]|jgi:protein required for attachment to host cells|nr:host attachment family protein [Sphingomicrobium sp.]